MFGTKIDSINSNTSKKVENKNKNLKNQTI